MSTPGSRKVVVDIVGDAKGYKKATDEAVKDSGRFSSKMEALDQKLTAMGKRGGVTGALLGGVGVGAGLGAFSLIERGVGNVVGAMGDAVQAAIEDERATAKLTQTIKANVSAWNGNLDVVNAAIDAGAQLAYTDDEVRDGLNQLIPRTKDLTEAIRLNRLAMDLARAKGMGLEEAATLVGKAFSGQASALRRAGIAIKNTKDGTAALAELQAAVSGQAETYAGTTEGAMKRLDIQTSEALESLGYALKPVVSTMADLAAKTIPAVLGAFGNLGDALHNIQRLANPGMAATEDLNLAILAQAPAMDANADSAMRLAVRYREMMQLQAENADLVTDLQTAIRDTDPVIDHLAKMMGKTNDEAKNTTITGLVKRIKELSDATGISVKDLTIALDLYGETNGSLAKLYQRIADIEGSYRAADGQMKEVNLTLDEQATQFLALAKAGDDIGAAVRGLIPDFSGARGAIKATGDTAAKAAHQLDLPAIETARTVRRMRGTLTDALDPYKNAWRELAEWAKDPFRPQVFADKIKAYHDEAIKRARQAAKDGKPKVAERWREVAKAMENPIAIAAINIGLSVDQAMTAIETVKRTKGALERIKDILTQIGDGKPGKTPKNPGTGGATDRGGYRAAGGPVDAGGAYVVGERGRELFVPEQDGTIIPAGALDRAGRSGSVHVQNITVHVHAPVGANLAQAGQQVAAALQAYQRNGGAAHVKRAVNG